MARATVRYKRNEAGFIALRNSEGAQAVCYDQAYRAAISAEARAPFRGHYGADVRPGKTRCHARAFTASEGTFWQELKHHGPLAHSF